MLFESKIPREFVEKLLKKININHDAEMEAISKPKPNDFDDDVFIVNILPNGDTVGAAKVFAETGDYWAKLIMKSGEPPQWDWSVRGAKEALRGMSVKGKFFAIETDSFGTDFRAKKPTQEELRKYYFDDFDALAGGIHGVYYHMKKVFLPKLRFKMETMIDDIYANLRYLSNEKKHLNAKTEQERALECVAAIEKISKTGFDEDQLLKSFGKYQSGFNSFNINDKEFENLLQTEPNIRAKWAKIVLESAKTQHDVVKNMHYTHVVKTLKKETDTETNDGIYT